MTTILMPKNAKYFICEKCDFKCSKLSNYNAHVLTRKHTILQNTTEKKSKNAEYICHCNKVYKHHSSLWNHKKHCNFIKENKDNEDVDNDLNDKNLILTLIQQNNELQKQMLEVIKNGTNTNNNTFHNNNSHNKTFNLQVFLNETCKDAMNIMDFVDTIKIQLADMESVGELGFVNGMSKLILKNLKALDENMRPVHCSDPKRVTMYVKDSNVWEKEGRDNLKIKKAIKYIAHKNICALPQWREKYPDCIYSDSRKSDQYNRLIIEAMGGEGNDEDGKSNKIITKIAKEVVIDKSS
jgi:hypothetical protein